MRRRRGIEFEYYNIQEECSITREGARRRGVPYCEDLVAKLLPEALKANNLPITGDDYALIPAGALYDFNCDEKRMQCWMSFGFHVYSKTRATDTPKYTGEAVATFYCSPGELKKRDTVCTLESIEGTAW
ncbi:MAG: hypothetical protein QW794_00430 [Thermosphaera sp.]